MTPYVQTVLERYRTLPTAAGHVRRSDRQLAESFEREHIPLAQVETALMIAALRRLHRPASRPALQLIRSLHYIQPILQEVRQADFPDDYVQYLEAQIARLPSPS